MAQRLAQRLAVHKPRCHRPALRRQQSAMKGPRVQLVSRFVARAPALPVAALQRETPEAEASLAGALAVAGREVLADGAPARRSYRARMAFRPTPAGLFAGVAVGELGPRTEL